MAKTQGLGRGKFSRRRYCLVAQEQTYAQNPATKSSSPVPTATHSTNNTTGVEKWRALPCLDVQMRPLDGDEVTRTLVRDYFGGFARLIGQKRAVVTIVMEMYGHGNRPDTANDPSTTSRDWRRPLTTSSGTGTPEAASATNPEIKIPFLDLRSCEGVEIRT